MRLFDEFERVDAGPAHHSEDSFTFMNRSASVLWTRVREQLDRWFAEYASTASAEKAADLRARFRRREPAQHLPSWWELYLFWLVRRSHPEHHIQLEVETLSGRGRADFSISPSATEPASLIMEALTTFTGIVDRGERHAAREAAVLESINELRSEQFFVWIEFQKVGPRVPRKRQLLPRVSAWLDGLNFAQVQAGYEESRTLPRELICLDGWEIELRAVPKRAHREEHRLIGVGPSRFGWVDDVTRVRGALDAKRGRYEVGEAPLILAVLPTWATDDVETAFDVLYGREVVRIDPATMDAEVRRRPDGFWFAETRPIAGVLIGAAVFPWTAGRTWPRLWLNPNASTPLPQTVLPAIPRAYIGPADELVTDTPAEPPSALLDLPREWPEGAT